MPSEMRSLLQQAWLIAMREYRERVRSRAFLLTTILTPLIFGALIGGSALLAARSAGSQNIAVAGSDAALVHMVSAEVASHENAPHVAEVAASTPQGLNARVESKELSGYLWLGTAGQAPRYVSGSSADIVTGGLLSSAVERAETRRALLERGISGDDAGQMMQHVHLQPAPAQWQAGSGEQRCGFCECVCAGLSDVPCRADLRHECGAVGGAGEDLAHL